MRLGLSVGWLVVGRWAALRHAVARLGWLRLRLPAGAEEEGPTLARPGDPTLLRRYTKVQATFHQRDLRLQAAQQTLPTLAPR